MRNYTRPGCSFLSRTQCWELPERSRPGSRSRCSRRSLQTAPRRTGEGTRRARAPKKARKSVRTSATDHGLRRRQPAGHPHEVANIRQSRFTAHTCFPRATRPRHGFRPTGVPPSSPPSLHSVRTYSSWRATNLSPGIEPDRTVQCQRQVSGPLSAEMCNASWRAEQKSIVR